ncbi:hypothetical protein NUW54_g7512 [Trametes sanguinea]|uniref:Uncharacterized protein n=1 Tax=Trametes sanguinea TaxID=158606 RepID=A0ACC1PK21_9APHY|nr:hypothetical protein NUW54_g7512 [Trametes sanguinea]
MPPTSSTTVAASESGPGILQGTLSERLSQLEYALQNLPESLPAPEYSDRFHFGPNYRPDEDDINLIGTVPGAINRALEVAFGFGARTEGDGILPITERGAGICGLVDALRLYRDTCPAPERDTILAKWIDDIWSGAKKAYELAQKPFPPTALADAATVIAPKTTQVPDTRPKKRQRGVVTSDEGSDVEGGTSDEVQFQPSSLGLAMIIGSTDTGAHRTPV